jgi:hypothetical protein
MWRSFVLSIYLTVYTYDTYLCVALYMFSRGKREDIVPEPKEAILTHKYVITQTFWMQSVVTHIHTYTHTNTNTPSYTHTDARANSHARTRAPTQTQTHTHAQTNTHIHTHTHAHTRADPYHMYCRFASGQVTDK